MHRYTEALATAFGALDLAAIAELQSHGKVEDRFRDDLLLQMRRDGYPISKGGPHRFDLFVPGEWAFELKMLYRGDHAFGLRGSRADVVKLQAAAAGMVQVLATVVSWHDGQIYANARRCEHGADRDACLRHWMQLIGEISGRQPVLVRRDDLALFLVEL